MAALRRGKRYELTEDLNQWAGRLIRRFRMKVSPPPVLLGRLDGPAGYYRCGSGFFGFWDEITLDERYVKEVGDHHVLLILNHEVLPAMIWSNVTAATTRNSLTRPGVLG